jgi:hypothetical protein
MADFSVSDRAETDHTSATRNARPLNADRNSPCVWPVAASQRIVFVGADPSHRLRYYV